MASPADAPQEKKDWARSFHGYLVAWGLPTILLIVSSYFGEELRSVAWSGALVWMGTACLVNARRCGRTHCRFTGPYYFLLIVPVLLLGFGAVSLGPWGWWILGGLILFGSKVIWIGTERAWGRYKELE